MDGKSDPDTAAGTKAETDRVGEVPRRLPAGDTGAAAAATRQESDGTGSAAGGKVGGAADEVCRQGRSLRCCGS